MNKAVHFFTSEQGNLLIRLLMAHIIADFVLQSSKMVSCKKFFSKYMLLHIIIVFALTWLFSGAWRLAFVISILHWFVDSIKVELKKKYSQKSQWLFAGDQLMHLLFIVAIWCWYFNLLGQCYKTVLYPFTNYKISLILLGYALVIWPFGYALKYALHKMAPATNTDKIEHGGKLIGQFERIIILTFVLLGQYEAIGFLITGKSILRFAQKENLMSEYVLAGTMMSYSVSIIIGVIINWLLSF